MADIVTGLVAHWKMNDNVASDVVIDSKGIHSGQFRSSFWF